MTVPAVPSAADGEWAKLASALEFDALDRIRAVADKWRTGLSALAGVTTTALAVAAPFVSNAISDPTVRVWIGVFSAVALGTLAAANWAAMRAAFGFPKAIDNSGEALKSYTSTEAGKAVRLLCWARWLTLVGVISLGLAGLTAFFFNGTSASTPSRSVVTTVSASYCGVVTSIDDGRVLVVTADNGVRHTLPVRAVRSLSLASGCS